MSKKMTTADTMAYFRMAGEAKKAKAIGDNSIYGENLPEAQMGIPLGMRNVGSPVGSKNQQKRYKKLSNKIKREEAREHRQIGRAEEMFNKGMRLKDKAKSGSFNEKKAARLKKRGSKAINKAIDISNKYL